MCANSSLLQKISLFCLNQQLIQNDEDVILGLSGGPDSVFLLHVLLELKRYTKSTVYAVHINHMLRGAESDEDEQFVLDLAKRLNVVLKVYRVDVRQLQKGTGESLEMCARSVRYRCFAEEAQRTGAGMIATAHTADDRIETALLRLITGSSLTGLTGLTAKRPCKGFTLVRPLIKCWKEDILAYLEENKIPYRQDASNFSPEFIRNRIRNTLIPEIIRNVNPNFKHTFSDTLDVCRDQALCLTRIAETKRRSLIIRRDEIYVFDKQKLLRCDRAIIGQMLLNSLYEVASSQVRISSKNLIIILDNLVKNEKHIIPLPQKCTALIDRNYLILGKDEIMKRFLEPDYFEQNLTVPGEVSFNLGIECTIRTLSTESSDIPSKLNVDKTAWKWDELLAGTPLNIRFFLFIPGHTESVTVRFRKSGDRITLTGGSKKLKKAYIDAHIPSLLRNVLPVVLCEDTIIWSPCGLTPGMKKEEEMKPVCIEINLKI